MSKIGERLIEMSKDSRREWLSTTITFLISGLNFDKVVRWLRTDEVLDIKLREFTPTDVLKDFLEGYSVLYEYDPVQAHQVVQAFLSFIFRHEAEIPIDDVVAWLQPLGDSRLLQDAVELAESDAWLPPNANRRVWERYSLQLRRIRANLYRRNKLYAKAERELQEILPRWAAAYGHLPAGKKELAILKYEQGYIDFLQGKMDEATALFEESADLARQAHDRVGELIGKFVATNAQFHSRQLSAQHARATFCAICDELKRQRPLTSRVRNWIWNAHWSLFLIACELRLLSEAKEFAQEVFEGNPAQFSPSDIYYRKTRLVVEGTLAIAEQDWHAALTRFAQLLDVDLQRGARQEPELMQFADQAQETARLYRDMGIALRELKDLALARTTWQRGLQCPDDLGNFFYKKDIQQLLAELPPADKVQ